MILQQNKGFRVDVDLAVSRLKQDMWDDWYPDVLSGEDLKDDKTLKNQLDSLIFSGGFRRAEPFDIPKPGFTLRYGLETCVYERLLYQAIGDSLIESFDHLLHPSITSYRKNPDKSKWMFRPVSDEWLNWIANIKNELDSNGNVLLRTDIQNYFESINVKSLCDFLHDNSKKRKSVLPRISLLKQMLSSWSPYRGVGIPQNRDPSSFLGNLFLHPVDSYMIDKGYNYHRWVDDIMVVCTDKYEARQALQDLITVLRKQHLNLNGKKTSITNKQDKQIQTHLPDPNWRMQEIDALLRKGSMKPMRQAIPLLKSYLNEAMRDLIGEPSDDRPFRFCLHRIEKIICVKNISFSHEKLTDFVIDRLLELPWFTHLFCRYLSVVSLSETQSQRILSILSDTDKHIYGWQVYHLWNVLGTRSEVSEQEISLAKTTIKNSKYSPEKAAAAVFLGKHGNGGDRRSLARNFGKIHSQFTSQAFVVAIQEVSEKMANQYVRPFLQKSSFHRFNLLRSRENGSLYYGERLPLDPEDVFKLLPGGRES